MNALFRHGPELTTISRDGVNFTLLEGKEIVVEEDGGGITLYQMPAGSGSDGASIPEIFAPLGLAHYGDYWPAAFCHDAAFRRQLLVMKDGAWQPANLTEARANQLIAALMFALGTDEVKRKVIYDALVEFGKHAYDEDQKLYGHAPA